MDNYVKGNVDSYQGGKRQDYDDIDLNRHIANTLHMNLSQDLICFLDDYLKAYHIPNSLKDATVDRVLTDLLNS